MAQLKEHRSGQRHATCVHVQSNDAFKARRTRHTYFARLDFDTSAGSCSKCKLLGYRGSGRRGCVARSSYAAYQDLRRPCSRFLNQPKLMIASSGLDSPKIFLGIFCCLVNGKCVKPCSLEPKTIQGQPIGNHMGLVVGQRPGSNSKIYNIHDGCVCWLSNLTSGLSVP
jgi:hypothetical protein